MQDKENNQKLLEAEIGNLEVQISEYRQIIAEKLQRYEKKYGTVFTRGSD